MKCKCGNDIEIKMGSNIIANGCKILTAITVVVSAQCEKCNTLFQVPITSEGSITKNNFSG